MGDQSVQPVGRAGAAVLGLYGGIRCGVKFGLSREQLRKLFEMVFDVYEQSGIDDEGSSNATEKRS